MTDRELHEVVRDFNGACNEIVGLHFGEEEGPRTFAELDRAEAVLIGPADRRRIEDARAAFWSLRPRYDRAMEVVGPLASELQQLEAERGGLDRAALLPFVERMREATLRMVELTTAIESVRRIVAAINERAHVARGT